MVRVHFKKDMIAPCGMNCGICVAYFGHTMSGKRRGGKCIGCRARDKNCAFVKKGCELLTKKKVKFCFECSRFPCDRLKVLDKRYRKKYDMSMIENLRFIKKHGMKKFLASQRKKYRCPGCGGVVCVHDNKCYTCKKRYV